MKIKNSHELSYFHAQAILHLQSIFNYYRKKENGQLGEEDEKFVEAIHKFSQEFISLSKLKTKSQSFQTKENEEKTDSHKQIRSSFSIDQEIISEAQGASIKKRIASQALQLQTEIDQNKPVRKRKKWWDKCELKSKRKGIFVASSPEFKEKKSSSCQNLNLKSKEIREEKSNNQLKISNVSEFSKKKEVFEESITTKVSSTLNIQKKALSAKNLPTQLSFSIPNKSEKKSLFDSQLRDRENVGSSSRNILQPWRKVVNTSKVHPNSLSLTTSKKKISNIENEILNPQQMRELFMKKRLKIDKNNYIPKTITEYR